MRLLAASHAFQQPSPLTHPICLKARKWHSLFQIQVSTPRSLGRRFRNRPPYLLAYAAKEGGTHGRTGRKKWYSWNEILFFLGNWKCSVVPVFGNLWLCVILKAQAHLGSSWLGHVTRLRVGYYYHCARGDRGNPLPLSLSLSGRTDGENWYSSSIPVTSWRRDCILAVVRIPYLPWTQLP